MQNLYLSTGALELMNKLRANHSIMWIWALSLKSNNVPAIVNLLIQRKILKVHGRRSKKIITPTKRGWNIVNGIVSRQISLEFKKLHKQRDIEIICALSICIIGFLVIGFNRWWLLRIYPISFLVVLEAICCPCYFFAMTDLKIASLSKKIRQDNTLHYLIQLFHNNHFKWTHNIQKYCTVKS